VDFKNRLSLVRYVFFFSPENANLSSHFCRSSEYGNGVLESVDQGPIVRSLDTWRTRELDPSTCRLQRLQLSASSATLAVRPILSKSSSPSTQPNDPFLGNSASTPMLTDHTRRYLSMLICSKLLIGWSLAELLAESSVIVVLPAVTQHNGPSSSRDGRAIGCCE